jgi:predicted anti-sigma-YlaC factor YlaD
MNQCQKIQEQLLDQFRKQNNSNLGGQTGGDDLAVHLRQCESCRSFQRNLKTVGKNLDDFGAWADTGVTTPRGSYFESLITATTAKKSIKFGRILTREVSTFVSVGILILTGAVLAVGYGYWLPVAIIFGLISMQSPLLILLREPEGEREV